MRYAVLGRTGVRVSRICVGTAALGVAPLAADAPALFGRALDLGINFFDTANTYGNQPRFDRPGAPPADQRAPAEEILGAALHGHRHEVVLASKVGERAHPGANGGGREGGGLTRIHIMAQVERSLRRLRTDYLDIYYAHQPDPITPIEETLRVMDDLVRQGKVRYFGVSNFPAWQLTEAVLTAQRHGLPAPVCQTVGYSMTNRQAEWELVPACVRLGVTLTPFSPLAGGLLSGLQNTLRPITGNQRWRAGQGPGYTPQQVAVAEALERLAVQWGHPPAHLALAWLLARPAVASAVIGPGRIASLEEDAGAADISLTAEQLAALEPIGADLSSLPRP